MVAKVVTHAKVAAKAKPAGRAKPASRPTKPAGVEGAQKPLTLVDLNRATLARQMLLAREREKPLRAIERLAGLQSQWPKPPHIGLWSRIEGFEREDLLGLLRRREAVRASMIRGTLHVVSAKDYVVWRPALQPMLTRAMLGVLRERMKGIDVAEVEAIARRTFADGSRTSEQLRDALAAVHPKADHRAMAFLARMTIPLVQAFADKPAWGFPTSPEFALAESWLGKPIGGVTRGGAAAASAAATSAATSNAVAEGLASLVLRYLSAFGPATAADVQTWSGLQGAKEVLEGLRPQLVVLRDERKRELFDLREAPRPDADAAPPARFLPEFDNLVLAHTDRRRFVADAHRKRVYLPGLRVAPTFLVDGFVAGTWGVERKKETATLAIEPFAPIPKKTQTELGAEAEGLVRFMEPDARTFDIRFARPRA